MCFREDSTTHYLYWEVTKIYAQIGQDHTNLEVTVPITGLIRG